MEQVEYRFAAGVAVEGRTLSGIAMPYGGIARLGSMRERFVAGAFAGSLDDVVLDLQDDGRRPLARSGAGLTIMDDERSLRLEAVLPNTRDADDALELVNAKIARGFSVGFLAREQRSISGVRVVERAVLTGIGLVTKPAYTGASCLCGPQRACRAGGAIGASRAVAVAEGP